MSMPINHAASSGTVHARLQTLKTRAFRKYPCPGYRDHVAWTELTIIAKASGQFAYAAKSVLVEIDPDKVFQGSKVYAMKSHPPDRALLRERFDSGFGGLVAPEKLEPLRAEYFPSTPAPPTAAPNPSSTATSTPAALTRSHT
jgi:hypothetical protein